MIAYTYAAVLFFTIIICFIASFDKRLQFYKHFKSFILAAIVVATPFIIWDIWFTAKGVWWFNKNYTLGFTIAGLPIEEWLFFICIPFSCVFTYYCVDKFFELKQLEMFNTVLAFTSIIVLMWAGFYFIDRIYTCITAFATAATILYLNQIAKVPWLTKASAVYTVLLLGFFPVNGVLTGTGLEQPIVNYNPEEFMGYRMGTIPVEDMVYGYTQFLLVVYFFKKFRNSNL
jgi:lycopene cyclase domain-containing protein